MLTYGSQGVEHPEEDNPKSTSGEVTHTEHPLTKLKLRYKAKLPIKFPHSPGYVSETCCGCASSPHEPPSCSSRQPQLPWSSLALTPRPRAGSAPAPSRMKGKMLLMGKSKPGPKVALSHQCLAS